jgi:hypothetical protein
MRRSRAPTPKRHREGRTHDQDGYTRPGPFFQVRHLATKDESKEERAEQLCWLRCLSACIVACFGIRCGKLGEQPRKGYLWARLLFSRPATRR